MAYKDYEECKRKVRENYYKNKEAKLDYQKKYYYKNKEAKLEYQKKYVQENREKVLESKKKYYQDNKEEQLENKKTYYQDNKEEIKKKNARHYRDNIDHHRDYHLKRKFGIGLNEYNLLLESQDYACAICGSKKPSGRGNFHVDHCHKTGRVRGLLCHYCNTGLGSLRDDPLLLSKALDYLRA
tara:strand:+ start:219 stop:767 length:549 start_codon:yes stop_codon:yes gene_type:complete